MTISHRTLRAVGAASLALALVVGGGVTAAVADTPDAAGTAHAHPMRGGDPLMHAMWQAKSQLNLNTSQQAQWDAAVALAKSAHAQEKTLHQGVKATSDSELAKTTLISRPWRRHRRCTIQGPCPPPVGAQCLPECLREPVAGPAGDGGQCPAQRCSGTPGRMQASGHHAVARTAPVLPRSAARGRSVPGLRVLFDVACWRWKRHAGVTLREEQRLVAGSGWDGHPDSDSAARTRPGAHPAHFPGRCRAAVTTMGRSSTLVAESHSMLWPPGLGAFDHPSSFALAGWCFRRLCRQAVLRCEYKAATIATFMRCQVSEELSYAAR